MSSDAMLTKLRFYLLQNCLLSQDALGYLLEFRLLSGAQLDKLRQSAA